MLSRDFVRENIEFIKGMLASRNMAGAVDMDAFVQLDAERKRVVAEVEKLRNRRNTASEEIARLKKAKQDASDLTTMMRQVGETIKEYEAKLDEVDRDLRAIELTLPNIPHESVPKGKDERSNAVVRTVGEPPTFAFEPKSHADLGVDLGILDFERASKITGSRFAVVRGAGARLERALINFMLDLHRAKGYEEILPPFMVNAASCTGTGQLPKFAEDLFKLEGWDYYLVPTAEVPVTNLFRNETLPGDNLPIKLCAYTPCFRSEAGSWGKDTRGLIRQHQFNKVELVKFAHPDHSYEELEGLTADAESVLRHLGLPYRVVALCTGDLGFGAAKCYDLEVWLPSQKTYREISSCSNFQDFQARRAGIRFKQAGMGKSDFVHTLNGSGLAVGRTMVAILENYQREDGSVAVPAALVPYMDGVTEIIKAKLSDLPVR
jgi:seryl-tRNA synthetase